ncbi:hypothetical protein SH501x_000150 [Pirellulaceae bacterium SH501]
MSNAILFFVITLTTNFLAINHEEPAGSDFYFLFCPPENGNYIAITLSSDAAKHFPQLESWIGLSENARKNKLEELFATIPGIREVSKEGARVSFVLSAETRLLDWHWTIPDQMPENCQVSRNVSKVRFDAKMRLAWHSDSDSAQFLSISNQRMFETWPVFLRSYIGAYRNRKCSVLENSADIITIFTKTDHLHCISVFRKSDSRKLLEVMSSQLGGKETVLEEFVSRVKIHHMNQ